jgi:uncharacterized membrane protein
MAVQERNERARHDGKDALARGLGWFSLGLGAAQIVAPRRVARLIGLRGEGAQNTVMRAVGVREIASGVGILSSPRPAGWLLSRVAGDAMDLALLASADSEERSRRAAAMAAVAGVTLPDLLESTRLSRLSGDTARPEGPARVRKAITVNRDRDEVYGFWRDFANLPRFMAHLEEVRVTGETRSHWVAKAPLGRRVEWDAEIVDERPGELIAWRSLPGATVENEGVVRFQDAPGGRGTEIVVELEYRPPAGTLGATVAKLLGEDPATQLSDDLRRLKQVLETGEVVVSDATLEGHSVAGHLKQRPAQPPADTHAAANGGRR